MGTPPAAERKALGEFLASRRRGLRLEDTGIVAGHRRTPGLRREEVAQLAGISVSWYTWLEQGRNIGVSAAALGRLARALRLDRVETEHLLALSSRGSTVVASGSEPGDGLLDLVQAIDPVPAYVRNDRLDILAWNPAVADLFVNYGDLEPRERNTLRLMFLHPAYPALIHEWERVARATIGMFRARRAKATAKAPFDALVEDISAGSAEFRRWWEDDVGVESFEEGVKRLNHPTRGQISLTYVALVPEGRFDLSFVSYLIGGGEGDERS